MVRTKEMLEYDRRWPEIRTALKVGAYTLHDLMREPIDVRKLVSSMTLFYVVCQQHLYDQDKLLAARARHRDVLPLHPREGGLRGAAPVRGDAGAVADRRAVRRLWGPTGARGDLVRHRARELRAVPGLPARPPCAART